MSFQVNVPPSVVAKIDKSDKGDEVEETETTGKRREDWRKLKELEEARKAGTAPAMQDEEGKDINPHIPQYIMQAPWYFGSTVPTLRHQRQPEEKLPSYSGVDRWYKRGVKEGTVTTKYRKGACENCGAMTHKKKDCLERPRKVGAKYTGEDFAPDEHVQSTLNFDYVGKRDRWNGYDTSEHKKIYEDYQKIEEAKSYLKSKSVEEALISGEINEKEAKEIQEQEEEYDDDDKYADDMDMPGQKMDSKQRITVRNLRIREDTAKYLHNLDVNSAYYDPKTRSMRENPFSNISQEPTQLPYAGDNFVRWSGDSYNIAKRQQFAWEAYEKGADVHLQGDPTKLEMLAKQYKQKKEEYKTNIKESIMDKYGGEEHLEGPPKQLLLAQSEDYVEYSRHGTIIKGQEKAKIKSKYEEDIFINNHASVWGSYWNNGRWGFQCCHSCIKESYCTGEAGRQAAAGPLIPFNEVKDDTETKEIHNTEIKSESTGKASFFMKSEDWKKKEKEQKSLKKGDEDSSSEDSSSSDESDEEKKRIKKKKEAKARRREKKRAKRKKEKLRRKKKKKRSRSESSSSSESEDEDQAKEKRIQEAMKAETLRVHEVDRLMTLDERKRPYNSMYDVKGPTEEEIEAFNRKRSRTDDPMAPFL